MNVRRRRNETTRRTTSFRWGAVLGALLLTSALAQVVPGAAAATPTQVEHADECEWVGSWTRSETFDDPDGNNHVTLDTTSTSVLGAAGCRADMDYVWDQQNPCNNRHSEYHGLASYEFFIGPDQASFYSTPDGPAEYTLTCDGSTTTSEEHVLGVSACPLSEAYQQNLETVQALVLSCGEQSASGSITQTLDMTIRVRRSVCDPSIDTDGGGVSDCEEYEAGTDPTDPDDDAPCESDVQTSYDAFRPYAKESPDAWLQFDLETVWCQLSDGTFRVFSVTPGLHTLTETTFAEHVLTDAAETFLSYSDVSVGPTDSRSGNQVEARATLKTCLGIPVLGKIKYVKKLPKAFEGLAALLKGVDGKWERVADKAAKLALLAAKALRWAIDRGSRAAKWAARQAVEAFGAFVYALGERTQLNVLLATVAVLADWSSSIPEAKWALRTMAEDGAVGIATRSSDLLAKFLETKVCWNVWRPEIHQTLGVPGPGGTFVDRSGDLPWRVERHSGAF